MIKVEDVKKAMGSKGVKLICSACGNKVFSTNTDLSMNAPIDSNGNLQIGKQKIMPVIQMACNNCGYVMEFDPRYLGLLEDIKE